MAQPAPQFVPQSQQESNDRYDTKLFTGGLDHVEDSLDAGAKEDLQGLLAGTDNPAEAKAQMVNISYAARHTSIDPDKLASMWPAVRDQFASQIAERSMSNVSDTELYKVIGDSITKRQGEQAMLGKVQMAMLRDAIEGQTSYLPTLQRMHGEMAADPHYDPKHEDQYLYAAKGAWAQVSDVAAKIAPVAKMTASLFQATAENPGASQSDQSDQVTAALKALSPQERQLALTAATDMAGKTISQEQDQGKVRNGTVEMLGQGTAALISGAERTALRLANYASAKGMVPGLGMTNPEGKMDQSQLDDLDLQRSISEAYQAANTQKGSAPMRAWYNFAGQLPGLAGMVLQPQLGVSLALGQLADSSMGELEKRGVPQHEALVGGLVAAAPAAAIMKLQGSILAGESMPWLGKLADTASSKLIGGLAGKTLGHFATNLAVLNFGQAAQDALVPAVQDITSRFDSAVPQVDWKKEFSQIGATRVDAFINLLPLALVGAGAGAFKESGPMRAYLAKKEFFKAAGFSEDQLEAIAKAPDAATATELTRKAWADPKGTNAERTEGHAAMGSIMDESAGKVLRPDNAGVPIGDDLTNAGTRIETAGQLIGDSADAQPADIFGDVTHEPSEGLTGQAEKTLAANLSTIAPGEAPEIAEKVAQGISESRKLGIAVPMPAGVSEWLGDSRRAAADALKEIRADPQMGPFKTALNALIGKMQRNTIEVRQLVDTVREMVPKARDREGITNWIQADGDRQVLEARAKATSLEHLKRGYEAALKLTDEQVKVAKFIKDFYAQKFKELEAAGLVKQAKENYVNQIWRRDFVGAGDRTQFAAKLERSFKFGKESTFGSFFEGEQADFKPATKDIGNLLGTYLSEANKVIATREFLKSLTTKEATDSTRELRRPLAAPFGGGSISQSAEEGPSFIRPMQRSEGTGDYKIVDHPAMRDWKWLGEDANGQPVMLEGQLAVHPEIHRFINALIGRDRVRDWYNAPSSAVMHVVKAGLKSVDVASSQAKGLMFSLSGYHQVQESVRAIGYRINPFTNLPELDAKNPMLVRSTDAGLMLAADHGGMRDYMEGYGSNNIFDKVPIAGDVAAKYSHWFFESYLPRLKLKTWQAVVERNSARYASELESGKMKQSDVDYLSATQVNAAYGHLNYVDLGRSPTAKHIARLAFLAPDFLESTGRTVGQAGKALLGSRAGLEQIQALAFLAATQWLTCRVLNKTVDGDFHFDEPFGVISGNRTYSMRSIPADIFDLVNRPRQFASGRISPLIAGAWEIGSGKNYRGEQIGVTDALRDVATNTLPMSLRPFLGKVGKGSANVPLWDQFITSNGLRISRNSDINSAFHLGQAFAKAHGLKDDGGVYPVSEWQQMRYALEDGDLKKAQAELDLVKQTKDFKSAAKLIAAFKSSLFRPFAPGPKTADAQNEQVKMEQAFEGSLKGHDRAVFDKAVAAREKVWEDFLTLNHEAVGTKQSD